MLSNVYGNLKCNKLHESELTRLRRFIGMN